MASRQVYPTASSSTSLDRDQKPPPLDFSRQFSEEDEVAPYNYQPDPEYHAQYPSSHYLSPAVNNALRETPSSTSLVPSDGGTSEQGMNGGNNWSTRRPPVKKRSWIAEAFFPDSVACRLYLMIVVVETLLDLAIECIILVRVNHAIDVTSSVSKEDSPTLARSRIPVYLGVFGMAHVFQFMLALDAVYYKNVLQFVFLAIFNALFFLYAVIQIFEVQTLLGSNSAGFLPSEGLTIAIPVVVSIAEIAYVALGWRIYSEFGWQVFKLLGADRQIKRIYMHYQIFQCLMRFDVFFWLGFSVQLIALVLEKGDFEFYLTIAALPLSMLLIYEGHLAARHESRWMMSIFGVGSLAAMVYFVYKLFRIWSQRHTDTFKDVFKTLTVFDSISVAMLILTGIWAVIVYRNFDFGLKHHLNKRRARPQDELELGATKGGFKNGNPNRMSIE